MKKLIACLVALTFVASCAKLGMNKSENSEAAANKYSATKAEPAKEVKKADKKEKKKKAKKHGGSEVK